MDWGSIAGIVIGNLIAVGVAIAAHGRWQADRAQKDRHDLRNEFQGGLTAVRGEIGVLDRALTDHRVEDARIYVTRDELHGRLETLSGEIKGLRADLRADVRDARGGE
jgi:hypothetical protein